MKNEKYTDAPRILVLVLGIVFLSSGLSACVETRENQGYVLENHHLDRVQEGMSKEQVLGVLGSPTLTSNYGQEKWVYLGQRTTRVAFSRPDVIDQEVLELVFENDVVSDLQRRGLEDARDIAVSKEITPTEGNEITVLEQLLGNLGRFNPKE